LIGFEDLQIWAEGAATADSLSFHGNFVYKEGSSMSPAILATKSDTELELVTNPVAAIPRPQSDERKLWDVVLGHFSYHMLLVAHNLGLFELLAQQPLTLTAIATQLNLADRATQSLLTSCGSLDLIQVKQDQYALTPLAQDYLLQSSPTYFGGFLSMVSANHQVNSYPSLLKAIQTNQSQVYDSGKLFQSHEEQAALARSFTLAMHGHSMGAAMAWTEKFDLADHQVLLDIGGGSGAHAIVSLMKWPQLNAIVADLPPVCEVADEFTARFNLQNRMKTQPLDMWKDDFPTADVHFYADIYHDWTPAQGEFLTRKSFASLPAGGRILLHEMLLDDQKMSPNVAANYNTAMMLWTEGQQYSRAELVTLLETVGFVEVEVVPIGYWSLVTGRKP
jgi:cyclopropane fatty-acyl-phospholipid synthase-like methyltransferase